MYCSESYSLISSRLSILITEKSERVYIWKGGGFTLSLLTIQYSPLLSPFSVCSKSQDRKLLWKLSLSPPLALFGWREGETLAAVRMDRNENRLGRKEERGRVVVSIVDWGLWFPPFRSLVQMYGLIKYADISEGFNSSFPFSLTPPRQRPHPLNKLQHLLSILSPLPSLYPSPSYSFPH